MDVGKYIDEELPAVTGEVRRVELSGWLIFVEAKLFLLEENFGGSFADGKRLRIANSSIIFPVRDKILPLGGGESFIFHKAKIFGELSALGEVVLVVERLFVLERGGDEFFEIDLSSENIEANKKRYGNLLEKRKSDDWLDF